MAYHKQKIIKSKNTKTDSPSGNWRGKIWNSSFFSFFLLVLLVLSFIKVGKEVLVRYEINKEIKELQSQLIDLEDKSRKMEQLVAYLNTEEYIEKQARLKMNLSKPGEKQIFLSEDGQVAQLPQPIEEEYNMVKWFNYFFR